jgi:hypothetical protein
MTAAWAFLESFCVGSHPGFGADIGLDFVGDFHDDVFRETSGSGCRVASWVARPNSIKNRRSWRVSDLRQFNSFGKV